MPVPDWLTAARGSSLLEALVAVALVVTVTSGVAYLVVWQRRATWSAGVTSMAVTLAAQKIEGLQSLPWEVDASGAALSDETTDLSTDPPSAGGSGLRPSPSGSLARNTPRFVDYLDAAGRWCGTGPTPAARAAFVRRWSIEPFSADPANTLVFTVVVVPLADAGSPSAPSERGARLTTIRTRVLR